MEGKEKDECWNFSLQSKLVNPQLSVLQEEVQEKLTELLEVECDDVLAEYIIVMIGNRKTIKEIAQSLYELVGQDLADSFALWLGKKLIVIKKKIDAEESEKSSKTKKVKKHGKELDKDSKDKKSKRQKSEHLNEKEKRNDQNLDENSVEGPELPPFFEISKEKKAEIMETENQQKRAAMTQTDEDVDDYLCQNHFKSIISSGNNEVRVQASKECFRTHHTRDEEIKRAEEEARIAVTRSIHKLKQEKETTSQKSNFIKAATNKENKVYCDAAQQKYDNQGAERLLQSALGLSHHIPRDTTKKYKCETQQNNKCARITTEKEFQSSHSLKRKHNDFESESEYANIQNHHINSARVPSQLSNTVVPTRQGAIQKTTQRHLSSVQNQAIRAQKLLAVAVKESALSTSGKNSLNAKKEPRIEGRIVTITTRKISQAPTLEPQQQQPHVNFPFQKANSDVSPPSNSEATASEKVTVELTPSEAASLRSLASLLQKGIVSPQIQAVPVTYVQPITFAGLPPPSYAWAPPYIPFRGVRGGRGRSSISRGRGRNQSWVREGAEKKTPTNVGAVHAHNSSVAQPVLPPTQSWSVHKKWTRSSTSASEA